MSSPGYRGDLFKGTAANRYAQGFSERDSHLRRARRCAALTIPSLFRPYGSNFSTDTPQTWQAFGAYCVNNLASKLTLTEFPPGIAFIRQRPSRQALRDLAQLPKDKAGQLKQAISQGLAAADREFVDGVDEDGDFANLISTNKHLIVGGTHGIQFYHDGTVRDFDLGQFVIMRDKAGNLLEHVVEDQLAYETLPDDVRQMADARGYSRDVRGPLDGKSQAVIRLFTHGYRQNGKWHVYQECYGDRVPGAEGIYDDDSMPFLFPPLNLLPGESYGRSYVEDFEAEFQTLDGAEQTVAEGSAAAALFVRLVRPGGVTAKKALAQALNGDVITGDPSDVSTLDNSKVTANFASLEKRIEAKMGMLAKAFLLQSSIQRSGERVTAEEIRYMAQELQDALGGVYSNQVVHFQRPYGLRKIAALQRTGRMISLPKSATKPVVVTGAAALSRNAELNSLDMLIPPTTNPMAQLAPKIINPAMWFSQRATALSLDSDGLVLTPEEFAAMQAQEVQQQQLAAATPELIKQGGNIVSQGMQHGADAQAAAQQPDQAQPPGASS